MRLEFPRLIFENSNIKFHQNLSSGSRIVQCGGQTDMKLKVVFCNIANAPKRRQLCQVCVFIRMQQLSSHLKDFYEILYLSFFENLSRNFKFV
jgi:hypothetical protein